MQSFRRCVLFPLHIFTTFAQINDTLALLGTVESMIPYVTALQTAEERARMEYTPEEFVLSCHAVSAGCSVYVR